MCKCFSMYAGDVDTCTDCPYRRAEEPKIGKRETTAEWRWRMNYCKRMGLDSLNESVWAAAGVAWGAHRQLTAHTIGKPETDAGGTKADTGKLPLDLLAFDALAGTASVLQFGAAKYAPRNWEKGIAFSRVFAALLRHLFAWWRGEDSDPETKLSHLHHAACCIMFLQAYTIRNTPDVDDRPDR